MKMHLIQLRFHPHLHSPKSTAIAVLLTAIVCMGTQCRKEEITYKYAFVENIDLFPFQKSYAVGDTIWLRYSNPSKKLFDQPTGKFVVADTISITFQVSFNARYNTPDKPAAGFCDFVTANGVNQGYGAGFLGWFGCNTTNSYDFIVGVVPKQKGIYSLDFWRVAGTVGACTSRVSGFPLSTIGYRFNLPDCNKDIYLSIPPSARGESPKGTTEREIDNKQVYIVKVD